MAANQQEGKAVANSSFNRNPTGRGGFACRPQDRYRVGQPGFACCCARTKRTGTLCKNPPSRGRKRCFLHGANGGRGNRTVARSVRVLKNKTIKAVRADARAQFAAVKLHPETLRTYRAFAGRVYPPDEERFLLMLDDYVRGEMPAEMFRTARRALFGL
jgi:hypothetical protein